MDKDARSATGASFREAIATWRLNLRTEVKKASALPTAMFDACDPMLEARLAETAEAMFSRLQEPDPVVAGEGADHEPRLELVVADELRALPRRIAAAEDRALDLTEGNAAEYLGILVDACCTAPPQLQPFAVRRLSEDFGVQGGDDLGELTQLLAQQAEATLGPAPIDGSELDLAAICRRTVAAVAVHRAMSDGGAR